MSSSIINQYVCLILPSAFFLKLPSHSGVSKKEEEEEADKWLNPYALANRAIFASYLSVGFGLYFILTPLTFYMVRHRMKDRGKDDMTMKYWNGLTV